jgi:glycosyltransferase involved in cell wall biosynthesis
MPRVSICIPTYNTARYLAQTIESVLEQEFDDYELVVCDNASTDATPEICRRYSDPRFRYARYEELTNQSGNFNRCLKEARGEFLTLLHSDDCFLPGFLQDRVERLTRAPEVGFVFGAVQVIDADGKPLSVEGRWKEDQTFAPGEMLEALVQGCIVCPPSMMVRRSAAEAAGPFRTDLTWGHDWEWSMRLAEQNAVAYAAAPLAAYRVHDASGTAEVLNAAKNGRQERQILQEVIGRLASQDRKYAGLNRVAFGALARRHMYFAGQALLEGRRAVARYNLRFAALANPTMLARPTFWALLLGSFGPVTWYHRYHTLRHGTVSQ